VRVALAHPEQASPPVEGKLPVPSVGTRPRAMPRCFWRLTSTASLPRRWETLYWGGEEQTTVLRETSARLCRSPNDTLSDLSLTRSAISAPSHTFQGLSQRKRRLSLCKLQPSEFPRKQYAPKAHFPDLMSPRKSSLSTAQLP
jgi:hypothetical protein